MIIHAVMAGDKSVDIEDFILQIQASVDASQKFVAYDLSKAVDASAPATNCISSATPNQQFASAKIPPAGAVKLSTLPSQISRTAAGKVILHDSRYNALAANFENSVAGNNTSKATGSVEIRPSISAYGAASQAVTYTQATCCQLEGIAASNAKPQTIRHAADPPAGNTALRGIRECICTQLPRPTEYKFTSKLNPAAVDFSTDIPLNCVTVSKIAIKNC